MYIYILLLNTHTLTQTPMYIYILLYIYRGGTWIRSLSPRLGIAFQRRNAPSSRALVFLSFSPLPKP